MACVDLWSDKNIQSTLPPRFLLNLSSLLFIMHSNSFNKIFVCARFHHQKAKVHSSKSEHIRDNAVLNKCCIINNVVAYRKIRTTDPDNNGPWISKLKPWGEISLITRRVYCSMDLIVFSLLHDLE